MKPLIIIAGPTASGKTKTAVELAKAIGGEIISADSMQVYRGMDIGTAKVREEEKEGVKHHLIDVLDPDEPCSIATWQAMVKEAMEAIYSRGKIPILAGGTGFYIQSIIYDVTFEDNEDDKTYRESLGKIALTEEGRSELYEKLIQVDLEASNAIHRNNSKRVIRALEYFHLTGEKISVHNEREKAKESPYNLAYFVLTMDREMLYERINQRIEAMVEEGLVLEVSELLDKGYDRSLVSMQGLGYKEIVGFIDGQYDLEEALYVLKRDTRHFAKRQFTWFKREKSVKWVDTSAYNYDIKEIVNILLKEIEEKKIM